VRAVQLHGISAYAGGTTGCICKGLSHAPQLPVIERKRSVVSREKGKR
jgi:hypothetical protein